MKTLKIILLLVLSSITHMAIAQELPAEITTALKNDDATKITAYVTTDNINACYGNYSLLSETIRYKAKKCFDMLVQKGADVNKTCNGYVPPIMHAAKYGSLEMVKILVAKGANVHYQYSGDYEPADGETPVTYAEKYKQTEIAEYLKTLK